MKQGDRPADDPDGDTPRELAPEEVADWLTRHPNFLVENPDLLAILTPPEHRRGEAVLDMQRFMLEKLRSELDIMRSTQGELIATTRSNMSSQTQIHAAVLGLLSAGDLEHLIHTMTQDFTEILDVDAVSLCVETNSRSPLATVDGVTRLPRGTIEDLMGEDRRILLRDNTGPDRMLFGPAADLVRSDALVRLVLPNRAGEGMIAIGSRTPARFHPGQGSELLAFLARVVEDSIRLWLERNED
ncbi:DUF484 family protein [Oceanibacterium hippocampi]|uniref:DUF484 domain-containing protein n=1 Tax=Oceanibacterium hippocampi TaxID=745714 RepID=A0A1Y5RFV4_9PROT|nr:DUF484 family protein [Oceanibacterium hippocampi]SLN13711.1 hypothetical protein OCH7691_00239 [Oceanibacterium hippocampi]